MDRGDRGGRRLTRRRPPRGPIASLLPLLALAPLLPACRGEDVPPWHDEDGYRWRELRVRDGAAAGFDRLDPARLGIDFLDIVPEDTILANEIVGSGAGVAIGDADGDGRPDLYFGALIGDNALYRNLDGWRFERVEGSGAGLPGELSRGVVFADVDGDGDADLLVTVHGGRNALLLNDGTGAFERRGPETGFHDEGASTTATLADVDGDGDLDLYVANHKYRFARDMFPPEDLTSERMYEIREDTVIVRPEFREHFRVFRVRGEWQQQEIAEPDEFYLNDGTGRFRSVPWTEGRFRDAEDRPLPEAPRGWGLTARFYDVDRDGDPDLYVCNDIGSEDLFLLNDGTGTFRAVDRAAFRSTSSASMAVDFSDIERDGDVDFLVTEMLALDPTRRQEQTRGRNPDPAFPGEIYTRLEVKRNTLQVNRGDGTYAEVAWYAGLAASEWTFGTLFLDADLDGYEDVFATTGHVDDILDGDAFERVQSGAGVTDWRRARLAFPPLEVPNVAFRNLGTGRFTDVGEEWGFSAEADISHGIAAGDLDGDGDLDLVVTRLNRPPLVYRNEVGAPRIAVRLAGRSPNTAGVGAEIRLHGGVVERQAKEVTAGGMYLSGSQPLVVFGARTGVDHRLEVRWPSGTVSAIARARANRLYEVEEPAAGGGVTTATPAAAAVDPAVGGRPPARPHFEDVTEELGHRHAEPPFDEFRRQPLVPLRLSQLGPGVSWEDVDGDGDPDLVVGTGRGGRPGLYVNEAGRFRRLEVEGEAASFDQTTLLGVPDGRGGRDLLVGQSSYEAASPAEAREVASVLRLVFGDAARRGATPLTPRVETAVPGSPSSTGPLALADVEGDGDLDLFVGGRVYPGAYPVSPSSRLYRNAEGRWKEDREAGRALREVGLVSAATFTDVDGDGDADLALAVEWGPVRVYENDGRGGFREVTAERGLDKWPGRWNGVTAGDLDADGDLDLVATSWGENTEWPPTPERPLRVYYGDFDGNGVLDLVEARIGSTPERAVPVMGLPELTRALPYVRRQVPTYAAYARASVEEVLGPSADRAAVKEVVTLSHTVFWNRGGRYEAERLPAEAQWAPGFGVAVADLDGDGLEDLVVGQNFFATDPETPRYDAGRGVWLRGDGNGGFDVVPGQESGIRVYGDARGVALADYDGDGRVDLAVGQNGAETVLLKNARARPGVRVRLAGPPGNPEGVGAAVRVEYEDGSSGPLREVRAGSGYWSRDGAVQVLGLEAGKRPVGVWARWPGGAEGTVPLPEGAREITIAMPGSGERP